VCKELYLYGMTIITYLRKDWGNIYCIINVGGKEYCIEKLQQGGKIKP
jgi:hypothetical protein